MESHRREFLGHVTSSVSQSFPSVCPPEVRWARAISGRQRKTTLRPSLLPSMPRAGTPSHAAHTGWVAVLMPSQVTCVNSFVKRIP